MRTVISVIDLQSDLERERSRCARKGDPDKTGFARHRSASSWTADLGSRLGVPEFPKRGNGGPSAAPVFATRHCSLGIASRARQLWRHRSRLGRGVPHDGHIV